MWKINQSINKIKACARAPIKMITVKLIVNNWVSCWSTRPKTFIHIKTHLHFGVGEVFKMCFLVLVCRQRQKDGTTTGEQQVMPHAWLQKQISPWLHVQCDLVPPLILHYNPSFTPGINQLQRLNSLKVKPVVFNTAYGEECANVYLISDLEAGLQQDGRKSGMNIWCQPETEAFFGTKHI